MTLDPPSTTTVPTDAAGARARTIRIVVADDHAVVRSGLRLLLEAEEGFDVVAVAGDVDNARRMVKAHRADVLVLDLNMPGEPSLPAIPGLAAVTAVVVLTMQNDPAFARQALQAGARGYVLKEAADAELVEAVRVAAQGGTYLNPQLGARIAAAPAPASGPPDGLTEREAEILRLIALGHTNAEIGQQLFLSVRTVESHRAHIQQKTRRNTRSELVRYALEHGLVAP
jgi:two-component system response regulator NreC